MRLENTTEHLITINGHKDGISVTIPAATGTGAGRRTPGGIDGVDPAWLDNLRKADPVVAGYFKDGDVVAKDKEGADPLPADPSNNPAILQEENAALRARLAALEASSAQATSKDQDTRQTVAKDQSKAR